MPPISGYSFYENLTPKAALALVKKDPNEIQYIKSEDQTEQVQMTVVKANDNLILHIINPTDTVKEFVIRKNPANITNINSDALNEQDWQIAVMNNADVLRKFWFVYEDGRQPSPELWGMWLMFLSKTQTMTLRYLKRNGKTDLIPLSIQLGVTFFFPKSAEESLPDFETIIKIPKEYLAKIAEAAQKGKFDEKKCKALIKLYED